MPRKPALPQARPEGAQQATELKPLVEAFILQKESNGFSKATTNIYRFWLEKRLLADVRTVEAFDSLAVTRLLTKVRQRKAAPTTVHQCYRCVGTFARWLSATLGGLPHDPLSGIQVRVPKSQFDVPRPEEVQALLDACGEAAVDGQTFPITQKPAGILTDRKRRALMLAWRNRGLILAMTESGLRRAEVLHLDVDCFDRGDRETLPSFKVKNGKGGKDRVAAAQALTAAAIEQYLRLRGKYALTDPLFAADDGGRLKGRSLAKILERLSEKAGLPKDRWIHPHALRHFAGTSWAKYNVGLDQIRRQLGHESLSTTLVYVSMQPSDVQKGHQGGEPARANGDQVGRERSGTRRAAPE